MVLCGLSIIPHATRPHNQSDSLMEEHRGGMSLGFLALWKRIVVPCYLDQQLVDAVLQSRQEHIHIIIPYEVRPRVN